MGTAHPPRQETFFDARQKEGQSVIEFREELLSLMNEADGANIGVNDLICMMLQICLLYTSPSPRDRQKSRMPSSA